MCNQFFVHFCSFKHQVVEYNKYLRKESDENQTQIRVHPNILVNN